MVLPGKKNLKQITIEFISDSFLIETFNLLSIDDLKNLSRVCKRFHNLTSPILEQLLSIKEKQELLTDLIEAVKLENGCYLESWEEDRTVINHEMKKMLCILCGIRTRKVLYYPCKHLLYCEECSSKLPMCLACGNSIKEKITCIFTEGSQQMTDPTDFGQITKMIKTHKEVSFSPLPPLLPYEPIDPSFMFELMNDNIPQTNNKTTENNQPKLKMMRASTSTNKYDYRRENSVNFLSPPKNKSTNEDGLFRINVNNINQTISGNKSPHKSPSKSPNGSERNIRSMRVTAPINFDEMEKEEQQQNKMGGGMPNPVQIPMPRMLSSFNKTPSILGGKKNNQN